MENRQSHKKYWGEQRNKKYKGLSKAEKKDFRKKRKENV